MYVTVTLLPPVYTRSERSNGVPSAFAVISSVSVSLFTITVNFCAASFPALSVTVTTTSYTPASASVRVLSAANAFSLPFTVTFVLATPLPVPTSFPGSVAVTVNVSPVAPLTTYFSSCATAAFLTALVTVTTGFVASRLNVTFLMLSSSIRFVTA